MEVLGILAMIWILLGIIAELIGCIIWGWNGINNAIVIISLGFMSILGIILNIFDN